MTNMDRLERIVAALPEAQRVSLTVPEGAGDERWVEIEEWVLTSYTLVAPKRLARLVD